MIYHILTGTRIRYSQPHGYYSQYVTDDGFIGRGERMRRARQAHLTRRENLA